MVWTTKFFQLSVLYKNRIFIWLRYIAILCHQFLLLLRYEKILQKNGKELFSPWECQISSKKLERGTRKLKEKQGSQFWLDQIWLGLDLLQKGFAKMQ